MKHYATDHVGRGLDQLHGFVSNGSDLPGEMPILNAEAMAKLHEENIIPIWDNHGAKVVNSAFGTPESLQSLNNVLPSEALESLKEAHKNGTARVIHFDVNNPEAWVDATAGKYKNGGFTKAIENLSDVSKPIADAKETAKATVDTTKSVVDNVESSSSNVNNTAKNVTEQSRSFVSRLYNDGQLTNAGKWTVGLTVLAAVGTVGAIAYNRWQDKIANEQQNAQMQPNQYVR